ncbi:MAG TPA: SOS response-associated peptidase [Abditibacteriaceae bacterium]
MSRSLLSGEVSALCYLKEVEIMCGRYTLGHSVDEVIERFGVQQLSLDMPPRFNIAPTQPVAVVTQNGTRVLDGYRWGLIPSWAKDVAIGNRMINARAETLAEKPVFKSALLRRRCLVPADGFYEWKREGSGKSARKQPMRVHHRDNGIFAFAGLWDEWQSPDGSPIRSCTIITTTPNELMAGIHDRMPAILRREDEEAWLHPGGDSKFDLPPLLEMLRPYTDGELAAHPVSTQVNSPVFDAPTCIEPLESDDESGSQ